MFSYCLYMLQKKRVSKKFTLKFLFLNIIIVSRLKYYCRYAS